MELHIYSVKLYNDNTKRPKLKENQLGISSREFMYSVGNSTKGLGFRRECCWGYISIFENTPKSCRISPLKLTAILLSGSGKGTVRA